MVCTSPIFIGDEGTIFRLTVTECVNGVDAAVDVSSQTAMSFIFKKPGGTLLTVTPVFTGDGTDGQIEYVSLTGDINEVGVWCLQGEVTLGAGNFFGTSVIKFDVNAKLVAT